MDYKEFVKKLENEKFMEKSVKKVCKKFSTTEKVARKFVKDIKEGRINDWLVIENEESGKWSLIYFDIPSMNPYSVTAGIVWLRKSSRGGVRKEDLIRYLSTYLEISEERAEKGLEYFLQHKMIEMKKNGKLYLKSSKRKTKKSKRRQKMRKEKKQNINPPFISTEIKILPGGKIFIPTKPPKPIRIDLDKKKKGDEK